MDCKNRGYVSENERKLVEGLAQSKICRHQSWPFEPCGDYCVDTKEKLVEILYFRHFAKHFTFTSEGKNSRNKHLKNYFDVSVVIDIGYGNTNEK